MEFLMEWHSRYISGISMHVYVASVLTESTIRGSLIWFRDPTQTSVLTESTSSISLTDQ